MNYSPVKTVFLFFLGLIAAGTILLSLPIARNPGFGFSVINALFTSTSAVCVTGLTVVPTGEFYSLFGQIIILLLIQFGGMGYMFVSTVVALLIGKMSLKDRRILQEIFDISSFNDLKKLVLKALLFVLGIEAAGAAVLTGVFLKDHSFFESVYLGIFHAVSAFCNAGFSPFANSFESYSSSPVLLYTVAVMIIFGGLGFFVIVDMYDHFRNKTQLSLHSKVVLSMTAAIIAASFLFFFFSQELGFVSGRGVGYAVNNSFFQAISARTAGFNSVPVALFNEFTEIILIFLMSIGAAPGSTAGGLKITTLALVFIFVRSMLRAEEDFVLFKKRIPEDLIKKALVIFVVTVTAICVLSAILILLEPDKRSIDIVFEAVSAFCTVGLSMGVTPGLSFAGKLFVIIAMIAGRLGILALMITMLTSVTEHKNIKYPESRILVG